MTEQVKKVPSIILICHYITDVDLITAVAGTKAITPLAVAPVSTVLAFKQVYYS